MSDSQHREMRPEERDVILKLLEPEFPGRDELVQQLKAATVRTLDEDGCLEFLIGSGVKADRVKHVVPTEGEYEDPDGVTVHVLLHMAGDKAKELELYREDNTRVRTWPSPGALRVFAPQ